MTNLQVNIVVMVVTVVMYVVLRARENREDDTFLFWYESVHSRIYLACSTQQDF